MKKGVLYLGEFDVGGMRKGFGISVYPDGSVFEGIFNNDKPNGQGRKTYSDGSQFTGTFLNGKISDTGVLVTPNGDSYKG